MYLNESLTKAFDTIREATYFDSRSLVPHPENLKFQAMEERRSMHRLGMKMTEIVGNPEGEDLQYAAHAVRRHFWKELGLPLLPELATELPRFLLKPDHKIETRTVPQELADQLVLVKLTDTSVPCIVAANLSLLQKLLNLPDATIKFLTLAYAISSFCSLNKDEASGLKMALSSIGITDNAHRNRAVAVLLDVPIASVEAMFTPPINLVALQFVDAADFNRKDNLRCVFALNDEFVALLETLYRSHGALLAGILEPEQDFDWLNDGTIPVDYLYEILPIHIAECYKRTVLNQPLLHQHVNHLIEWFTGGLSFPPEALHALDSRIAFEAIRDAIKRAALACCQAHKPLDAHALLKAIYAASE